MTIRLNGQTSGYVELEAPATAGSNTLVLPTNNGTSGQYLQTNGSGALSWQTVSTGKILQVVSTTKTDTWSHVSTGMNGADTAVTGLSVNITPSSTDSKILLFCHLMAGTAFSTAFNYWNIRRGGSKIIQGDTAGNRVTEMFYTSTVNAYNTEAICLSYLDSPSSTSQQTYQVYGGSQNTHTVYLNRSGTDSDTAQYCRGVSTITAMEVAV